MALERLYPQNITPNGTNVQQGFINDDKEIKRVLGLIDDTGPISIAGTKRQCVLYGSVDSLGNPNFLTASGLNVSIDGSTKPIILSFANGFSSAQGTADVLDSISSAISNAYTISANGTYYLYIDKDINTGLLSYGYTASADQYLKVAPSSPVLDQHYFDLNEMKMYRYNGSAWEQKLRIFIAMVVSTTSAVTVGIYSMATKTNVSGVPTGTINQFAGAAAPVGYLLCQGQAVSRSTYTDLYAVIGTTYGTGDGSTTFNLPDLQDRVGVGKSSTLSTLGATGGEKTHQLTANEMPAHVHSAWTDSQGTHAHPITLYNRWGSSNSGNNGWGGDDATRGLVTNYTDAAGAHGHNVGIGVTGGDGAHNNMQPYVVINYIIKC
ncbi:phage tail protein [Pectinatus frisingensis]|uniref:phage tail protein n=1 Tax=Pectinatus frisingensis TaxID=865 RepID=UPI0018C7F15F|nr:tail fiber protein [Pectinatus frisingensis]